MDSFCKQQNRHILPRARAFCSPVPRLCPLRGPPGPPRRAHGHNSALSNSISQQPTPQPKLIESPLAKQYQCQSIVTDSNSRGVLRTYCARARPAQSKLCVRESRAHNRAHISAHPALRTEPALNTVHIEPVQQHCSYAEHSWAQGVTANVAKSVLA